jgi:DNA-binding NarL/FixJ family response regulator
MTGPHRPDLTPRQAEIVRLLARGALDESIARQLQVSVRTVRAEVAAILSELGAASRFEAGVRYGAWAAAHAIRAGRLATGPYQGQCA